MRHKVAGWSLIPHLVTLQSRECKFLDSTTRERASLPNVPIYNSSGKASGSWSGIARRKKTTRSEGLDLTEVGSGRQRFAIAQVNTNPSHLSYHDTRGHKPPRSSDFCNTRVSSIEKGVLQSYSCSSSSPSIYCIIYSALTSHHSSREGTWHHTTTVIPPEVGAASITHIRGVRELLPLILTSPVRAARRTMESRRPG